LDYNGGASTKLGPGPSLYGYIDGGVGTPAVVQAFLRRQKSRHGPSTLVTAAVKRKALPKKSTQPMLALRSEERERVREAKGKSVVMKWAGELVC